MNWTFDQNEVEWIETHLKNFWNRTLAGIAPTGFPAYGRLLHPATADGGQPARWREVAEQNGTVLGPASDFLHVALPEKSQIGRPIWTGDPPRIGTLDSQRAERLTDLLRSHTTTPGQVSFGLWDGLGWDHAIRFSPGHPPEPVPDPISQDVRSGPRIRIPGRDYLYYSGPIEDVLAWMPTQHQTPHLWWPKDHAWSVAGDVDLPWTIIAGSHDLIDQLAQDPVLEVLAIAEDARLDSHPRWLDAWVAQAVQDLVASRRAAVDTPLGSVSFQISDDGQWLESGGGRTRMPPHNGRSAFEEQLSSPVLRYLIGGLRLYD